MKPHPLARKSNCFAGCMRDPRARLRAREMRTRRSINHTQREARAQRRGLPARCVQFLAVAFEVFHQTPVEAGCQRCRAPSEAGAAPPTLTPLEPSPGPRGTFRKATGHQQRVPVPWPPAPHISPDAQRSPCLSRNLEVS